MIARMAGQSPRSSSHSPGHSQITGGIRARPRGEPARSPAKSARNVWVRKRSNWIKPCDRGRSFRQQVHDLTLADYPAALSTDLTPGSAEG